MKISILSYAMCCFLLVGSVFHGMAQEISLRTGLNLSNLAGIDSYDEVYKMKAGFHLGVLVDKSLPIKGLSMQSGLFWTMRGASYKDSGRWYQFEEKISSHYLQLPLWVAYKYDFGKIAISGFTGPHIAVGLSGVLKDKGEYWDDEDTFYEIEKYQLFGSKYVEADDRNKKKSDDYTEYYDGGNWGWKRFDVGWSLGAGVTVSRYYVGLQYDWGLINMERKTIKKYTPKNRNFSISVGYTF